MILSDREIAAALDNGNIRIDPRPEDQLWTSTAIDLTLHGVLLRWTPKASPTGQPNYPRPMSRDFNVQAMMEDSKLATKIPIDPVSGYALAPKSFVLGFTHEKIQLPHRSRIAARVEGKSSLARLGMGVHVTAPTIHAGFGFDIDRPGQPGQQIQLEIFNLGDWTVVLDAGMPIYQLILEELREVPLKGYQGKFKAQSAF